MGYYTSHSLIAKGIKDETEFNAINQWLTDHGQIGYAFENGEYFPKSDEEGFWGVCDMVKWYDSEDDMCKLAVEFPDVKFKLMCEGEDGEQWADFYYGGITDYVERPEFDPKPTEFEW